MILSGRTEESPGEAIGGNGVQLKQGTFGDASTLRVPSRTAAEVEWSPSEPRRQAVCYRGWSQSGDPRPFEEATWWVALHCCSLVSLCSDCDRRGSFFLKEEGILTHYLFYKSPV